MGREAHVLYVSFPCTHTKKIIFEFFLHIFSYFSWKTSSDGLPDASWRRFSSKMTIFGAQLGVQNRQKNGATLRHQQIFYPTWPYLALLSPTWSHSGAISNPNYGLLGRFFRRFWPFKLPSEKLPSYMSKHPLSQAFK